MVYDEIDDEIQAKRGIEKYGENNKFFRQGTTFDDFAKLPRVEFDVVEEQNNYLSFIRGLPQVVFVDLSDVQKLLNRDDAPGSDATDIRIIADIVCDFLGERSGFHEVLWEAFDEDITSEIAARFGSDESDLTIMQGPFDDAMEIVFETATLISNYLINARYPLVEESSVYKVGQCENGILLLQLRTHKDLVDNYG